MLAAIECDQRGVVLVARVDEETVRARATAFNAIDFITYLDNAGSQIACGPRATPENVLITLRLDAGTRLRGVAVAVESVPDEYEPYE